MGAAAPCASQLDLSAPPLKGRHCSGLPATSGNRSTSRMTHWAVARNVLVRTFGEDHESSSDLVVAGAKEVK